MMALKETYDWVQEAKDLARAERELQIDRWVYITFEYRNADRSRVVLHNIDIPQKMLERWHWLIEWRKAKLVCQDPRRGVQVFYCHYDKRSGLQTGFEHLLSRVTAAKAQITRNERKIAEYTDYMKHNDLFFNPDTDEQLHKASGKLAQKRKNYDDLLCLLRQEVEKWKNEKKRYKLFIGFDKLGEFNSTKEALDYAESCGKTGVFNLIGYRFRDSWYQSAKV